MPAGAVEGDEESLLGGLLADSGTPESPALLSLQPVVASARKAAKATEKVIVRIVASIPLVTRCPAPPAKVKLAFKYRSPLDLSPDLGGTCEAVRGAERDQCRPGCRPSD